MSSCSRIPAERRRPRAPASLLALLLAVLPVGWHAAPAAAAPAPLPVSAVLVSGAQTSLVVDLSASTRAGRRSVSVTRDGIPQQAKLVPVVSDGLAVALVVDTSAAGAATLPAWLSAAARFILEAPASTQAVVIPDSAPAMVAVAPQRGPTGVVRGLTSMRAHGDRDTAAALDLAVRQFPATAPGRRVVLLYTTGADAGGESAQALAARFRRSGTILAVVGTAAGGPYWANAASATGGFFAPAGDPVVIPALDQVKTTLTGRYLVQFPTPPELPSRVSVRIDTEDLQLTGDAIVATTPAPAAASRTDRSWTAVAVATGIVAVGLGAVVAVIGLWRRRHSRVSAVRREGGSSLSPAEAGPAGAPPAEGAGDVEEAAGPPTGSRGEPDSPPRSPVVARGRAVVPGAVARGRAAVPENRGTRPE